VEFPSLD